MNIGINKKRRTSRTSVFLILALLLANAALQILPALAEPALSAESGKEYTAGVPANFPPQYQVDAKTGKPYGFAIDVMDEVAKRGEIKVRYVVYGNISDVAVALRNGQIDIVPNFGITDERKKYADFTAPVETFHIHIFVRSTTDDIKNIDDLTGRKVAVVAENQGYYIMKERSGVELLVYNSMEEALMSLISGNADAMVFPDAPLLLTARKSGIEDRIKTTGDSLAEIKRAIGVRKGQPELFNKLDEAVNTFILMPEYEKIYAKWYSKPEPYWNTERVLIAVGIAIALISVLSFIIHYLSVLRLNKKLADSLIQLEKSGESLRQSEERYRTLAEAAHDTIFIIDGDDRVQYVNNFAAKLFGRKPEEIIGKSRRDIFPSPGAEHQKQNLQKVFETGESIYAESKVLFPASEIWLGTRLVPLRNENGKIVAVMGISRDITKHKHAVEALIESEEKFATIFKVAPGSIMLSSLPDGKTVEVNDNFSLITGYSRDEALGKTTGDLGMWVDPDARARFLSKLQTDGFVRDFEADLNHKSGAIRNGLVSGYIVTIWGKKYLMGTFYDITERKLAGEALRESETHRRLLFEHMLEAVAYHQVLFENGQAVDYVYLEVNEAFTTLTGLKNVVGRRVSEIVPDIHETNPELFERFNRVALTGQPEQYETYIAASKTWFFTTLYSLTKDIVVSVFDNITERKRAEEALHNLAAQLEQRVEERTGELAGSQKALTNMVDELNTAMEELRNANLRLTELDRLKSMFIASTSHELRTPLNSIIGFSSIMLEGWSGKLTTEQKEQLQLIHNSGAQLLSLINDVIDISKIEAGKLEAYYTEFRLKEVMDEAVATLRKNIEDKGLALSVDVPDITIHTDRRRLLQCILNYLSNAVKFSEKGSIKLTAKSINNRIDISITDTGIGMKEEDLSKLFAPFVRLESPISAAAGGTGLGLYLTKKLVEEALGGTVAVKSTYGKGSTFSLRIPEKMEVKT